MDYAHKLFDKIPKTNVSSWNAMLKGHAQNESHRDVVLLFCGMKSMDVMPNCFTLPIVLRSCLRIGAWREGEKLHCLVIKGGFGANPFVGTTLIDFYSCRGELGAAYGAFVQMPEKNVVAWTSIINGYIACRDIKTAEFLFNLAPERDVVLWNIMISGYIEANDMVTARRLFDKMPNKDVMSWNTVLNGYADSGDVEAFERLFEEMPERNIFSWNGLIGGYANNGRFSQVLSTFKRMLVDGDVVPNHATLVSVLSTCARLGALDLGMWVHLYAEGFGYKTNVYVANALVDMYAKCGIIDKAVDVFQRMDEKDLISWNTIINGLAVHGRGADALSFFSQMLNAGENPDGITYIGVLSACSHMGLVQDGFSYFQMMADSHSIVPQIEHYGCMVDLLARAGLLNQAVDFVMKMPLEADAVIWTSLLGACRVYKNVELAEMALGKLIEFEPKNPANYVMLSNIYGDHGRWKDVAMSKVAMRDTGFRKMPGCSSIEINKNVVEFYSVDERHSERDHIYGTLGFLTKLLRLPGYVPDSVELVYSS
ncbi:hypothetical protein K2173_000208 [Erythroxylum novogranatense]|uniref:Chlororespiratory reduction 4 n=1 Tax=Erythroxylum novogranatense TaxID=1862640 RepID=A0AAV8SVN4_9ROSI|nr:hypothetical protein K2173_000208 [Erythroxylum novogranatense]